MENFPNGQISSWNPVHQRTSNAPLIVTIFMHIDAQSEILWHFKNISGSFNFRKIKELSS